MKSLFYSTIITLVAVANSNAAPISSLGALNNNGVGSIAVTSPGSALTGGGANYLTVNEDELDATAALPPANNVINSALSFTQFGTMTATFNTATASAPIINGNARLNLYRFNVTLTNNTNRIITNFGVNLTDIAGGNTQNISDNLGDFPNTVGFDDSGFAGVFPTGIHYNTPTNILYGPEAGGGGGLAIGNSTILSFLVFSSPGTASSFTLSFTANPEPTSLALAGAALAGFGGVVVRRRRQAKNA
jgi:hypothetical protein